MEVAASYVKTKFRVAERLLQGPATLSQIARDVGVPRQTAWHYLDRFAENGIVEKRLTDDNTYVYTVIDPNTLLQKVEQIKTSPPRAENREKQNKTGNEIVQSGVKKPFCSLCHSYGMLVYYNGWYLCGNCLLEIKSMLETFTSFHRVFSEQVEPRQTS